MPHILVPLVGDDPDVPLDIRAALEQAYEAGTYRERIRYRAPSELPLGPDDQSWANALIGEAGA